MDYFLIVFFKLLTWSSLTHYSSTLVRYKVWSLPFQSISCIIIPLVGSGTLYDLWRLSPTSRFQFSRDSTLLKISLFVVLPVVCRFSSQTPIDMYPICFFMKFLVAFFLYTLSMFHIKSWNLFTPLHWISTFWSQINFGNFQGQWLTSSLVLRLPQDHQLRMILSRLFSQFFLKLLFWYVRLQVVQLIVFLWIFLLIFLESSQTKDSLIVAGTITCV